MSDITLFGKVVPFILLVIWVFLWLLRGGQIDKLKLQLEYEREELYQLRRKYSGDMDAHRVLLRIVMRHRDQLMQLVAEDASADAFKEYTHVMTQDLLNVSNSKVVSLRHELKDRYTDKFIQIHHPGLVEKDKPDEV